ncbi:uncharacterized protein LOC122671183 [Telopea speciosissima]|uniref:uncharacterized protein LOC122671183 n=1 Tax=Telopea speciosissima TaxID=54955 RepID=UPI001CC3993E|nr:uncharacterized protein LOC122671183 [Telopea speciosissima]
MRLIGWNCQGLGRPSTIRALNNLLKAENPEILFIMETKSKEAVIDKVRRRGNFQNYITVDPVGASGGLALLWKENVNLSVIVADTNFIDVEKEGGSRGASHDGEIFRDFLHSCEFFDLGFNGSIFTWNNKRKRDANIRIRLDRALCNAAWRQSFEDTAVFIKPAVCSDHCPIMVDTEGGRTRGKRPFRFESMWTMHEDCKNVAQKAWSIPVTGQASKQTLLKIAHCQEMFRKWNVEVFGNIHESIKALKTELAHVQGLPSSLYSQEKETELQKLLDTQLEREEEMWRQKSRADWLKGGDRNSSFFHVTTLRRRHRNKILKLKTSTGEWSTSPTEVTSILCTYFQELYASEPINNTALNSVLDVVQPIVGDDINNMLCLVPSSKEVHDALFRMAPLKSPGPDGLPPLYFQKYWEVVKDDLVALVEEFFITGHIPKELNKTFICLIPKVKAPESADQFRPISLCNIAFKVITKVIDRSQWGLGPIDFALPIAFVPGGLIS